MTSIATLVNRCKYKGGRKYRSAFRKLGKFRMNEIFAAGVTVTLTPIITRSNEAV